MGAGMLLSLLSADFMAACTLGLVVVAHPPAPALSDLHLELQNFRELRMLVDQGHRLLHMHVIVQC